MAEPNKETIRTASSPAPIRRLPPKIIPSPSSGPASAIPRQPAPVTSTISPAVQPLPTPPGAEKKQDKAGAAPPVDRGPKQETARINLVPRPGQSGAAIPVTPEINALGPVVASETVPRALCWALAGISSMIFLIQIWNYVVS
jgi:hypothetical protein